MLLALQWLLALLRALQIGLFELLSRVEARLVQTRRRPELLPQAIAQLVLPPALLAAERAALPVPLLRMLLARVKG